MAPGKAEARSQPPASRLRGEQRWRGVAFGLQLDADFFARGLLEEDADRSPCRPQDQARACSLALVSTHELEADWPHEEALVRCDLHDRSGRRLMTIEEHPEAGYQFDAPAYGRYLIARDGGHIMCAPADELDWEWQAFLIGQVLPVALVLHGREAMHASAVALGDHVIGLVAESRGGKSSLAINLVRHGAAFVADDVLALERAGERIVVHPGPTLASVRHAEADALGPTPLQHLGTVVGRDQHELRVALQGEPRTLGLAALYFIERSEEVPDGAIRELQPDPRLLLGHTFDNLVRTPARLVGQLDLYSQLARTVPTFAATVSPDLDAYGLAGSIHAHALRVIGAAA